MRLQEFWLITHTLKQEVCTPGPDPFEPERSRPPVMALLPAALQRRQEHAPGLQSLSSSCSLTLPRTNATNSPVTLSNPVELVLRAPLAGPRGVPAQQARHLILNRCTWAVKEILDPVLFYQ